MRKKVTILLIILIIVTVFVGGCFSKENEPTNKTEQGKNLPQSSTVPYEQIEGQTRSYVTVYYLDVEGQYLLPINIPIESTDKAAGVAVAKLLAGPKSEQVRPVMPQGTKLRDLYLKDNTAFVSLTSEFLNMNSPEEAKTAVKAVVLTLTEFPVVEMVQLLVDGQVVKDIQGLNLEDALPRPKTINGPIYDDSVLAYFGDVNANFLIPYTVPVQNGDKVKSALQALLEGPPKDDLTRTIWPGTKLMKVEIVDGIAIIDFSREVVGYGGGSAAENLLVNSLAATMNQFEDVKQIQLLIEGKKIGALPEGTDVSKPFNLEYNMAL